MKPNLKTFLCAGTMAIASLSYGQLQDEQDVTITMDLQPILQLSMEGPNQIDFTFDEINKYYTGVIKTGANILKVSSSVSFDLWAAGMSTGSLVSGGLLWDNPVSYSTVANNAVNKIPLTALELHQFPANPVTTANCATNYTSVYGDYSAQFAPFAVNTLATGAIFGANATNVANGMAGAVGSNAIYAVAATLPYSPPTSQPAATEKTSEKYIAGASTTTSGCQVNAGSWLFGTAAGATTNFGNSNSGTAANPLQTAGGYYFVIDYRILPGLPATFPSTVAANNYNKTAPSLLAAAGASTLNSTANVYAAAGVYTMFVKYILSEDQ